jgi:hypothetical protein
MLALAYARTLNDNAVRRLLHIAVSDTSSLVQRVVVFFREPWSGPMHNTAFEPEL